MKEIKVMSFLRKNSTKNKSYASDKDMVARVLFRCDYAKLPRKYKIIVNEEVKKAGE